jgi:hypothetical protein
MGMSWRFGSAIPQLARKASRRTGISREENPAATAPCSLARPVPCHAKFFEKLPGLYSTTPRNLPVGGFAVKRITSSLCGGKGEAGGQHPGKGDGSAKGEASVPSVLRQLQDDLDAAVFATYGWPPTLTDAEILERLVALNAERAKEEASGLVRWLRPDYQNPGGAQTQQTTLAVEVEPVPKTGKQRAGKLPWPKTSSERVKAVSADLAGVKEPVTAAEMAKRFARARAADAHEILEMLCAVGKARRGKADGTFLP